MAPGGQAARSSATPTASVHRSVSPPDCASVSNALAKHAPCLVAAMGGGSARQVQHDGVGAGGSRSRHGRAVNGRRHQQGPPHQCVSCRNRRFHVWQHTILSLGNRSLKA